MLRKKEEQCLDEMIRLARELATLVPEHGWTDDTAELANRLEALADSLGGKKREDAKFGDVTFITLKNGTHVPLKEGIAVGGPLKGQDFSKAESSGFGDEKHKSSSRYSSPYPMEEISAEGENRPCRGFSKNGLLKHKHERHPEQYASMTDEEYNEHAKRFLQKKCGPDVLGYRCSDGCICRFNRLTGEFAKGYPGGDIKTCFFPTAPGADPLDIDLDYARNYFEKWKGMEAYD